MRLAGEYVRYWFGAYLPYCFALWRWAFRHSRRWRVTRRLARYVSAATFQFADPDVRRSLREFREFVTAPLIEVRS